jgi:hypothetical protein
VPSPPPTIAAPAAPAPVRTTPSAAQPVTSAPRPATTTTTGAPAAGPEPAGPEPAGTVSLVPGRPVSLESADGPGTYVTTSDDLGYLAPVRATSDAAARRQATFTAVAGFADADCFSFRSANGRYLRHSSWRLRLDLDQGTALFRGDATFCVRDGASAGTVSLESSNYPGWFVHHRENRLWVDQTNGSAAFRTETSFRLRPPLA